MDNLVPNKALQIRQPNNGDVFGNVWASYNMDFSSNRGRIKGSSNMVSLVDETTSSQLAGYAAQITEYDSKLWAVSDQIFRVSSSTPTGTWALDSDTGSPNVGNTVTDAVSFDGMLLVVDGNDIQRNPGDGDWDSWWTGIRSQSALSTGQRFFLKVGPQNDLFIFDGGNKVYRVLPNGSGTGTISTTGAGTLDFSYSPIQFTCVEMTSTRMWIGFEHNGGGSGGVIEWDMSSSSFTANRIHSTGAKAVRCIAIWQDTPIAILSDGDVQTFNGSSFVDFPGVQFPSAKTEINLNDDFIHPNGWAIIDGLPHFLVRGSDESKADVFNRAIHAQVNFPSGVWCLDPEIGLYCRFAIGEAGTNDMGQAAIRNVGALYALRNTTAKFLASYEYFNGDGTNSKSVIAYHDLTKSKENRSWFITTPAKFNATVELLHKKLASGDKVRLFYRRERTTPVVLSGAWATTTTFHTTDTSTGIQKGDMALVKSGKGAGRWLRISNVATSASTTVLTFDEANSSVTAGDDGGIVVMNFRFFGDFSDTGLDEHSYQIPGNEDRRSTQLLIELRQAVSSKVEIDNVIIN